ncbi:MAG: S1C family serine protease, partial [Phycisphaerae bacterium]|nr:S1C family serine protease [Phycisphaerae bacterium]
MLLLATSSAVADVPALGLGQLREFERAVQGVVERSMAATVCVRGVSGRSSGSGVIIDKQGLILTAAHVTAKAGRDLVIIFPDGRKVKGKALGADTSRDAGMARITEKGEYPFVPVGKSGGLKQNDFCVSMGHPGGFDVNRRPPVRLGRVLRVGRFITTDCTLIGGDSGGPLFDLEGRVVGIHANIGAPLSHNNHVPIDVFHENWERLRKGEKWGRVKAGGRGMDPNRPVLGVELDAKPGVEGAIIGAVTPGSPAEEAGLEAGDVIYRVDGTAVKNSQGIVAMIREKSAGDEITLAIRRGNAEAEVTIELVRARDLAAQRSTTGEDED